MDKRDIAKLAAKFVVAAGIGNFVTKGLIATVPATSKLKTAEITGLVTGAVAADKLQPRTDNLVDNLADRIAKK